MKAMEIRERVGGTWEERPDGYWLRVTPGEVRVAAAVLLEGRARFSALVARPGAGGGLRLSWHWDAKGTLLTLETVLPPGQAAPSVADLYPGADWAERETREYYRIEFEGRAATPPLMLREGDAPGVLLRPEGKRP
ncbi:MAG TPA: NADH-quinone oxidoreductase subunit C [Anaeromyxobacteraceae bacterium]|nr:NADH-quinone oxidoreductase subunit C [Anaeromyxobacteraceae bacterium]